MDNSSYAVGWFALTFINTNIAQLKGRNSFGWFLLSLLGGPIATFFLMFAQPPYHVDQLEDREVADDTELLEPAADGTGARRHVDA